MLFFLNGHLEEVCYASHHISSCQIGASLLHYHDTDWLRFHHDTAAYPHTKASRTDGESCPENCVKQGGTLAIQKRGDGGEYGVCIFEDNRQCEEWAMLRGECPVGGIKITGYLTQAAQYCAITRGDVQVTGNSNTDQKQGTCTFKNGQTCDAGTTLRGNAIPIPILGNRRITTPLPIVPQWGL